MRQSSLIIALSMLGLLLQACAQPAPEALVRVEPSTAMGSTDAGTPLSEAQAAGIRDQIARYWNIGPFMSEPRTITEVVSIRVTFASDGKVLKAEVQDDQPNNPQFRQAKESALRAIYLASPLKLPAGVTSSSVIFRFDPTTMFQD